MSKLSEGVELNVSLTGYCDSIMGTVEMTVCDAHHWIKSDFRLTLLFWCVFTSSVAIFHCHVSFLMKETKKLLNAVASWYKMTCISEMTTYESILVSNQLNQIQFCLFVYLIFIKLISHKSMFHSIFYRKKGHLIDINAMQQIII